LGLRRWVEGEKARGKRQDDTEELAGLDLKELYANPHNSKPLLLVHAEGRLNIENETTSPASAT